MGSADNCLTCPEGRYSNMPGATRLKDCALCPGGKFGNTVGLTSAGCDGDCPRGQYSSGGAAACTACSAGFFANQSSTRKCQSCPKHETSLPPAPHECVCGSGFYRATRSAGCVQCPDALNCLNNAESNGIDQLSLETGWWRASSSDREFLRCPVESACAGGTNASNYCSIGHTGPLCAVCAAGYTRWSSSVQCYPCPVDRAASIGAAIASLLGILVLLGLCVVLNRRATNGTLRVLIHGGQMMSVVILFPVDWPDSLVSLGHGLQSALNLDVVSIASPSCLGAPLNFYSRFLALVAATAALVMLPVTFACIRNASCWLRCRPCRRIGCGAPPKMSLAQRVGGSATLRDVFLFVLLLHPTVSGQAFFHFRCRKIDEKWYLMADYTLSCTSGTWAAMTIPIILVILLFSLGVPIFLAAVLWKKRAKLHTSERVKGQLGVLYSAYKPGLYYYESVRMLFKLALWGILVFFEFGSQFQLAATAVLCFIQLGVDTRLEPYLLRFDNTLNYVSLSYTTFSAFSGLVLNFLKVSIELDQARGEVPPPGERSVNERRRDDFRLVTEVLLWAGVVVISVLLIGRVVQFIRAGGLRKLATIVKHQLGRMARLLRGGGGRAAGRHGSRRRRSSTASAGGADGDIDDGSDGIELRSGGRTNGDETDKKDDGGGGGGGGGDDEHKGASGDDDGDEGAIGKGDGDGPRQKDWSKVNPLFLLVSKSSSERSSFLAGQLSEPDSMHGDLASVSEDGLPSRRAMRSTDKAEQDKISPATTRMLEARVRKLEDENRRLRAAAGGGGGGAGVVTTSGRRNKGQGFRKQGSRMVSAEM